MAALRWSRTEEVAAYIRHHPGAAYQEIKRALKMAKSVLGPILRVMEEEGLVRMEPYKRGSKLYFPLPSLESAWRVLPKNQS